jgi:hypothetical protein
MRISKPQLTQRDAKLQSRPCPNETVFQFHERKIAEANANMPDVIKAMFYLDKPETR